MAIEKTDLERRVFAHERILQLPGPARSDYGIGNWNEEAKRLAGPRACRHHEALAHRRFDNGFPLMPMQFKRSILWLGVTAHPTAEWIAGARRRATWRASSARTTTSTAGRRTLTTPMPVLLTA